MMTLHPMTLFRLTVLGPLISRSYFPPGELKQQIRKLATQSYDIPGSQRCYLSEKTIEAWFYAWKRDGVGALAPKRRLDHGQSKITPELQTAILKAKRDNPKRSLDVIRRLLENARIEVHYSWLTQYIQARGTLRCNIPVRTVLTPQINSVRLELESSKL